MGRFSGAVGRAKVGALAAVFGFGISAVGCNVDYSDAPDSSGDDSASADELLSSSDGTGAAAESSEVGTSQQALLFWNPFSFTTSCSDSKGTNSVMAALAVATATELKRWQPTKDFQSSWGVLKLTSTGKAQCADATCWNTQAILDLQNAPSGKVQIRPGVFLDSGALKSALTTNLTGQLLSLLSLFVPEHKFQLAHSEAGGCDQYYWFNVSSPSGSMLSSSTMSTLQQNLKWVGGGNNPYIQFQTDGSMVGLDPTYGLNQAGSSAAGSCVAACTKMSSADITGSCCSCNGTKTFARSTWNTATYICQ